MPDCMPYSLVFLLQLAAADLLIVTVYRSAPVDNLLENGNLLSQNKPI